MLLGPRFNMNMSSYQYRKSHCGDQTVVRSSYLHNGISYTGNTTSLYWMRAQIYSALSCVCHLRPQCNVCPLIVINKPAFWYCSNKFALIKQHAVYHYRLFKYSLFKMLIYDDPPPNIWMSTKLSNCFIHSQSQSSNTDCMITMSHKIYWKPTTPTHELSVCITKSSSVFI